MKERLKLTDVKIKLVLIIIFGLFFVYAIPFPEKSKAFPQLLSAVSLILVIISLIFDFTAKETVAGEISDVDDTEIKIFDAETKKTMKQRLYKAWGIIIVSSAVGFLGGFLLSTFFLFLGFILFLGERKNLTKNIFIAVGITAFVYIVFGAIMRIPLLEGILW